MKWINSLIFNLLFIFCSQAQGDYLKFRPYNPYTWMIGANWSFVDNDGRSHTGMFDFQSAYLAHYYPTQIVIDRYLKHGFSIELAGSYNQITAAKLVNELYQSGSMIAVDLTSRYSFYKFLQPRKWFDPYVGLGVGLTNLTTNYTSIYLNANGVVGTHFWFGSFGVRLQGTVKFALVSDFYYNNSNYLHYSAGLMYKFKKSYKTKNTFNQKRYKWTRKRQKRYKGKTR